MLDIIYTCALFSHVGCRYIQYSRKKWSFSVTKRPETVLSLVGSYFIASDTHRHGDPGQPLRSEHVGKEKSFAFAISCFCNFNPQTKQRCCV